MVGLIRWENLVRSCLIRQSHGTTLSLTTYNDSLSKLTLAVRIFLAAGKDVLDAGQLSGKPPVPYIARVATPNPRSLTVNEVWDSQLKGISYQKILEARNEIVNCTKNGNPRMLSSLALAPLLRSHTTNTTMFSRHIGYSSSLKLNLIKRSILSIIQFALSP